jgi:hypothetical protein
MKSFYFKGLGMKASHRKLTAVFGSTAYPLSQVKELRARFGTGELSYQDVFRSGLPFHVLGKSVSDFLEEFPFAQTEFIA